ncbi:MAG: SIMPL domain-containing protein [Thermomicrobiales bacterium]
MTKRSLALAAFAAILAMTLGFAARPLFGTSEPATNVAAATPTAADVNARSITVVGNGEVKIKPDIAYIVFGVETTNANLSTAQSENATKMTAVLDKLKSLGIAEKDLQTVGYSVYPRYDKEQGAPTGYSVHNGVRATVRDINKLGGTIDAAVAAGANQVMGISFDLADKAQAMQQAREVAVNDARAKAEQYAKLINGTLGLVLTINESVSTPVFDTTARSAAPMAAGADTPIQTGEGSITLTVQISYEAK